MHPTQTNGIQSAHDHLEFPHHAVVHCIMHAACRRMLDIVIVAQSSCVLFMYVVHMCLSAGHVNNSCWLLPVKQCRAVYRWFHVWLSPGDHLAEPVLCFSASRNLMDVFIAILQVPMLGHGQMPCMTMSCPLLTLPGSTEGGTCSPCQPHYQQQLHQ